MNVRPKLPSLLGPGLRGWLKLALALAAVLLANTLYLLVNRWSDVVGWPPLAESERALPVVFQAMVLAHTGLGLLVVIVFLAFLGLHLRIVWKRRHATSIVSGLTFAVAGVVLLVTGLFILTAAASREHGWAWWAHVIAAAAVPAAYAAHRWASYVRPATGRGGRFVMVVFGLTGVLFAIHFAGGRGVRLTPEARVALERGGRGPGSVARDDSALLAAPGSPLAGAAWVAPDRVPHLSPFFPSPVTTTTGGLVPSRLLVGRGEGDRAARVAGEAREGGAVSRVPVGAEACVRCHPDVTASWSTSAHRYASFNNPFYEATIRDLRARDGQPNRWVRAHLAARGIEASEGTVKSQWCAGCHDPALLLTGKMTAPVDRTSVEAQAGITCLACHSIDRVPERVGNGGYNFDDSQEDPYLFGSAPAGTLRGYLHDAAVKARPAVHQRRMVIPVFRTSEYCLTCHKVSLTEPLNDYRWLRGQNEYDAWHDSGIAHNASRTFYLPPAARVCQDCHMPRETASRGDVAARDGTIRSHRFTAVNSALPFVRAESEPVARVDSLLRTKLLRVEWFGLRAPGQPDILDPGGVVRVPAGRRIRFDAVVRNLDVGHTFPGGTNDSNESWLEVTVRGPAGEVVATTGEVGSDGHLDPLAHTYGIVALDREGRRIQRRNAQDIFVTAARNLIGPGAADVARYEFEVPPERAGDTLTLDVELKWRKFDRAYTEFAYRTNPEGFPRFPATPDLPIHLIASDRLALVVGSPGSSMRLERDPVSEETPAWVRYNDYGIGLLLQGDTRAAAVAFTRVGELAPGRIDGPLNLARAALRDGNLEAAFEHLGRVESIVPGDPRAAWVWANVHQEDGRYAEAEQAYEYVLDSFPGDRAAWRGLGRTRYLDRRYEAALEAFDQVLAIDPEDRVAHFHRMLSLRALGRDEEARRAETASERYLIDESATAVAGAFRVRHPGVNLMAQPIHTHPLRPPANVVESGS